MLLLGHEDGRQEPGFDHQDVVRDSGAMLAGSSSDGHTLALPDMLTTGPSGVEPVACICCDVGGRFGPRGQADINALMVEVGFPVGAETGRLDVEKRRCILA